MPKHALNDVVSFYDELADVYHLIYGKWEDAISRQSDGLHKIIQDTWENAPNNLTVLDCSCGIGTQSIGLALLGYKVYGTDVSPRAVERARKEGIRMNAGVQFDVVDFRDLASGVDECFDIVLSCDNGLPHMTQDEDLKRAISSMTSKLKPEGLLLISMKDYDTMVQTRPRATPVTSTRGPSGRSFVFSALDWSEDGSTYEFDRFIVYESTEGWRTWHGKAKYRALLREELEILVTNTGLTRAKWYKPWETGYFQQVLTARKGDLVEAS